MPSEKRNSILAKATGLISSLFNIALSQGMSFCQLQQLQCLHHGFAKGYVLLCAPFLSPLLYGWRFAVCALWLQCETWMSAGALLALFFAWNVTQSVWTSWKWSIVIHHDQVTHPVFISNWAALWRTKTGLIIDRDSFHAVIHLYCCIRYWKLVNLKHTAIEFSAN